MSKNALNLQFFIPGEIIALLTFPGVILHEWSHKTFCELFGVKVLEVCYLRAKNPVGYVRHEQATSFRQTFFIDTGPFLLNSIIALFVFWFARLLSGNLFYFVMWLGISIGMHAFPSYEDGKILWNESKKRISEKNWWALIGFPVSVLIFIGSFLSMAWFDVFYALFLWYLTGFIPKLPFIL